MTFTFAFAIYTSFLSYRTLTGTMLTFTASTAERTSIVIITYLIFFPLRGTDLIYLN